MQTRVIDLNCKDKGYKFNLSVITEVDWRDFAYNVVLENDNCAKKIQFNGYKVVIRDNRAKVKIFYQDHAYHELEYRIDVLGRISKKYQDVVSVIWREMLQKYFGEEYSKFVELNLGKNKTHTVED